MSGRSFDDRVRDLVRAKDAESDPSRRSRPRGSEFDAPVMDMVARALAVPMPRRRAIGLISGAVLAGSAWRPSRAAAACSGNTPKACTQSGGAVVCSAADSVCCNTDKCAQACRGYQACTGKSCSDTPKLCGYPGAGYENMTKFCGRQENASNYCTSYEPQPITVGWCCRGGEVCGSEFNSCTCPGTTCGQYLCCAKGEVCETNFFHSRTACVKRCDDGSPYCNGTECCKGDLVCTNNGCACPAGKVQLGIGHCVPPKEDPGNPPWAPLRNFINMMGMSGASHSGSRLMVARPAQSGSSAVDAALVALAAVDGQGAAAALAFREGKRDPAFRRKVAVARVKPPIVVAGAGLDAASAAAINKLLAAEAKAYALAAASAKALWRMRAAKAKGQRAFAKSQLRASAKFAGQAASALKQVPALRSAAANALTAGGVAEVTPTEDQLTAFLATVKSAGIPTYLKSPLGALGVGSTDLKRLRAGLLALTVSSASGPALIAPLKDATQTKDIKRLASELSKFSKRARKHPIAR